MFACEQLLGVLRHATPNGDSIDKTIDVQYSSHVFILIDAEYGITVRICRLCMTSSQPGIC